MDHDSPSSQNAEVMVEEEENVQERYSSLSNATGSTVFEDAMDEQSKKLKSSLRTAEHENADLRFLNSQFAHKLRVVFNKFFPS